MKLNSGLLLIVVSFPAFAQHEKGSAGPTAQQVMERLRHGNEEYAAGRVDTSRFTVNSWGTPLAGR
jgi:hypothetical protein